MFAAAALAVPATATAGEPKNDVPFVTATSTEPAAGEPKNVAPFVAAATARGSTGATEQSQAGRGLVRPSSSAGAVSGPRRGG
jgi:hypothetical protein